MCKRDCRARSSSAHGICTSSASHLVTPHHTARSEQNRLEELKQENRICYSAIELLVQILKWGHSKQLLEGLLNALSRVAIKGQPEASIKRFLRRLGKVLKKMNWTLE